MIPSKTPEDNSSQPDGSSLGNAAELITTEEAWDLASPIYHAAEGASGYSVKKALVAFGEEYVRRKSTSGELRVVTKVKHEVSTEWDVEKGYKANIYCHQTKLTFIVKSQVEHQYCPGCGSEILPL